MPQSSQNSYEIRLYGLHDSVTSSDVTAFFSGDIPVLGVLIHPRSPDGGGSTRWAQVWMSTEDQVNKCLLLKDVFAERGITITRWPNLTPETQHRALGVITPPASVPRGIAAIPSTPGTPMPGGVAHGPRNLYVLGIPIDMTQHQFRDLFTRFGHVEHSTLLSQLDGAGRRRGFVLMSTNYEAVLAMTYLNNKSIDGSEIDVSWALVQRKVPQMQQYGGMPNRVIHPPTDTQREANGDNMVAVENLDPQAFPTATAVEQIFSWFGPIVRITMIPGEETHSAVITFQEKKAAAALLNNRRIKCGTRPVHVRPIQPTKFDPFADLDNNTSHTPQPGLESLARGFKYDPFASTSLLQGLKHEPTSRMSTPTRWPELGSENIKPFGPN